MTQEECLLILGLEKGYSDEQLKIAYRNSALVWHPDRFKNQNEGLKKRAEKEMKQVNEAFQSLKSNRFSYPQQYSTPTSQPSPPPPPRPSAPPQRPPSTTTPSSRPSSPPPTSPRYSVNGQKTVKPAGTFILKRVIQVSAILIIIIIEIRIAYKVGLLGLFESLVILGVFYLWMLRRQQKKIK